MTHPDDHLLDRLRDAAEGRLSPEQVRALEAELAADPALACDALAYRAIHRLTQPLAAAPEPSRLTFDDLPLCDARPAWRRLLRQAALPAAALLLLGLGLLLRTLGQDEGRGSEGLAPVTLTSVRLSDDVEAPHPLLVAGYVPVKGRRPAWLTAPDEARALAAATGRRILLYVHHQECPLCQELDRTVFADAQVLEALESLVPLHLDVETLAEPEARRYFEAGWPYLALTAADGAVLSAFPGMQPAATLAQRLADGAAGTKPVPWSAANRAALATLARREVGAALREARTAAASDGAGVRERLRRLAALHAGTPAADDLARLLAAWPEGAVFPPLVEAPR